MGTGKSEHSWDLCDAVSFRTHSFCFFLFFLGGGGSCKSHILVTLRSCVRNNADFFCCLYPCSLYIPSAGELHWSLILDSLKGYLYPAECTTSVWICVFIIFPAVWLPIYEPLCSPTGPLQQSKPTQLSLPCMGWDKIQMYKISLLTSQEAVRGPLSLHHLMVWWKVCISLLAYIPDNQLGYTLEDFWVYNPEWLSVALADFGFLPIAQNAKQISAFFPFFFHLQVYVMTWVVTWNVCVVGASCLDKHGIDDFVGRGDHNGGGNCSRFAFPPPLFWGWDL